ncbi:MAG: PDZ domain-containing protein [Candidatus Pacebacteria bacterium]|nr:PDZ domain-containing protein [Candidatus Paceibacterota bacterium]
MIKLSYVRNLIVALLLVVLGGMLGYRFHQTGQLPLNLQNWPVLNRFLKPRRQSSLAQLIGDPEPPENLATQPGEKVNFDAFWEVWALLEDRYLESEKMEPNKMVHGAIAGMTAAIGDPYTIYLPPKDNQRSGEDLAGSFYGVGIELGYIDETLAVVAPLKGTPADHAGIQAGDLILNVKDEQKDLDESTAGWSLNEAVEKIRGPKGSPVTLTLYRKNNGNKPFEITVNRGEIIVETVELSWLEKDGQKIAHLRVFRFGERTKVEWDQAVEEILSQGSQLSGVILDLRNNPGGFFDRSIDLASDFVAKGQIVVSQKSKYDQQDFYSNGTGRLIKIPVVVLVNRGSASASEILAGALRDQKGTKLIGEKTFGKGTIQDRLEVSNGGGVHVTVGRWLLPKGDWIHDEGIPVSVEVTDDPETENDEVLDRALDEFPLAN